MGSCWMRRPSLVKQGTSYCELDSSEEIIRSHVVAYMKLSGLRPLGEVMATGYCATYSAKTQRMNCSATPDRKTRDRRTRPITCKSREMRHLVRS
jgi:hypothetical protein